MIENDVFLFLFLLQLKMCVNLEMLAIQDCLSHWRGEPKISTALAPGSVDIIVLYRKKRKKSAKKNDCARTAQRRSPILYRAHADRILLTARVSSRH